MNLLDHFHPPLRPGRQWHGFHNAWATYIASTLNKGLPEGYFAEPNVQFGIEIDVATFEQSSMPGAGAAAATPAPSNGSSRWLPPAPTLTLPFTLITDVVEVLVYDSSAILAAAIELVSPSNKDRAANREAFVSKCETYLQQRAGLIVIDVVTERGGNLHQELLARLTVVSPSRVRTQLYSSAYRPVQRDDQTSLEIWEEELEIGKPLPTMPLWLPGGISVPVEFGPTYERTCRELRIVN